MYPFPSVSASVLIRFDFAAPSPLPVHPLRPPPLRSHDTPRARGRLGRLWLGTRTTTLDLGWIPAEELTATSGVAVAGADAPSASAPAASGVPDAPASPHAGSELASVGAAEPEHIASAGRVVVDRVPQIHRAATASGGDENSAKPGGSEEKAKRAGGSGKNRKLRKKSKNRSGRLDKMNPGLGGIRIPIKKGPGGPANLTTALENRGKVRPYSKSSTLRKCLALSYKVPFLLWFASSYSINLLDTKLRLRVAGLKIITIERSPPNPFVRKAKGKAPRAFPFFLLSHQD